MNEVKSFKKKNIGIEALRFIFMLVICIWHYPSHSYLTHGYLGVEFFFILSGYLLYKTTLKNPLLNPIDFTLKKIKRFAPKYLAGLLISFIFLSLIPLLNAGNYRNLIFDIFRLIPESMMIQNVGFYQGGINYPLWFLCVLIVGGGMIYTWIYVNKRITIGVVLPLLIVIGFSFLFNISTEIKIEHWGVYGIVALPLLRGILDMSIGVLLAYLQLKKSKNIQQKRHIFNIIWIVSFVLVIILHFLPFDLDQYSLIFFSLLVVGAMIPGSIVEKIFRGDIWLKLGSITFSMLVLHASIIRIYLDFIHPYIGTGNRVIKMGLYILLLVGVSFLFDRLFDVTSTKRKLI